MFYILALYETQGKILIVGPLLIVTVPKEKSRAVLCPYFSSFVTSPHAPAGNLDIAKRLELWRFY